MPLPPKFWVPQIKMYDGSKDPFEHLETFKAYMTLHWFPEEIACKAFPLNLKGATRESFELLQLGLINSFGELAKLFLMQFMASRRRRRPTTYLLTVK